MDVWQYLIEKDCNWIRLDVLGAEGWELVAVTHGWLHDKFYFKRRVIEHEVS